MLLIPEIENWNIRSSHSVSNQKMKMGFIDNKNAKSQTGIALESTIEPSSSFLSLKLTETCQILRV